MLDSSALYAGELNALDHGYPLWDPQPTGAGGVQIGDVGYVLDGSFYRVFNIIAPAKHRYNVNGVPIGFTPFPFDPTLLDIFDAYMTPGIYNGRNVTIERSALSRAFEISSGVDCYTTNLTDNGALLVLADSARRETLLLNAALNDYVRQHHSHWYDYVVRTCGISCAPEDIVLVRGWVKTSRRWVTCSWNVGSESASLQISICPAGVVVEGDTSRSGVQIMTTGRETSRSVSTGSCSQLDSMDQCLFLVKMSIASAQKRTSFSPVRYNIPRELAHGIPLWHPDYVYPNRHEVQLGDVGFIDGGAFRRLFNVTVGVRHPWNACGAPLGFTPYPVEIKHRTTVISAGVYPDDVVEAAPICDSRQNADGRYKICCEDIDGFALFLPQPALSTTLLPDNTFEGYISRNWPDWLQHFSETSRLPCHPENIILVRGFVKASRWITVSFTSRGENSKAVGYFESSQTGQFAWHDLERRNMSIEHRQSVPTGETISDDDPPDQCVFLVKYDFTEYLNRLRPRGCNHNSSSAVNTTILEDRAHRTYSPIRDEELCRNIDPPTAPDGNKLNRSHRDIWVQYILEAVLFPGKLYHSSIPGRRTEDDGLISAQQRHDNVSNDSRRKLEWRQARRQTESSANIITNVEVIKTIRVASQHSCPYDFIVSQARSGAQHSVDAIEILLDKMQEVLDIIGEASLHSTKQGDDIANRKSSLRRVLLRTCKDLSLVPPSLFLKGIVRPNRESPFAGGSFADIYRATYEGSPVVLKRIRVFGNNHRDADTNYMTKTFYQEAVVWRQLKHPYILPLLGLDRDVFDGMVCMVSSWMAGGSLNERTQILRKQAQTVPSILWAHEIASGLQYLHNELIVHGDLRGANILVDHRDHIHITDFGLTVLQDVTGPSGGDTTYHSGACRWMAPEVLVGSKPTYAADIYSFGCVCLEIFAGVVPYAHLSRDHQVITAKITSREAPQWPTFAANHRAPAENSLSTIASSCWVFEPERRPSIDVVERELYTLLGRQA